MNSRHISILFLIAISSVLVMLIVSQAPCKKVPVDTHWSKLYFPHRDSKKFIQCDVYGKKYVKDCAPATVWKQSELVCVDGPTKSTKKPKSTKTTSLDVEDEDEK